MSADLKTKWKLRHFGDSRAFGGIGDVQNIDLMNLAGFCRNCLSKWLAAESQATATSSPTKMLVNGFMGCLCRVERSISGRRRPSNCKPLRNRTMQNLLSKPGYLVPTLMVIAFTMLACQPNASQETATAVGRMSGWRSKVAELTG